MVVSCLEVADYERATEWLETAERAGQDMVCFPGCCRVHHATVLRHRGEWNEAHREAHLARSECAGVERFHEGMALTEMGELYRYKGDFALAEQAFGAAYEKGWVPQPGLALVRFALEDLDGAGRMIQRSVDNSQDEPAALIRLLPAQVEIALAAGDEDVARTAASRLAQVVSTLGTSAAANAANAVVAGLLWQRGDPQGAAREFEAAVRWWQQARNPYEAGQTRMRLATVLETLGDRGSAHLELAAARTTFERLGAGSEAREAAQRLGDSEPTIEARAFMFTDIVNSTLLLTSIGDAAWHGIRLWHDRTIAAIVGEHRGRIVKETGDGFFAAFDDVTDGVECAVAIQRALDDHRRTAGFAPSVRIGLHVGSALTIDADFAGRDVVVAERIGSLAGAEQILVSGAVADQLSPGINVLERTARSLKGIREPVDVAAVDWQ
ncbi:MAG: hypothetical protein MUP67_07410, partial [Acidimicrobiia bacterium]|nr:hypothetical protein [Acidimicrobiia bacterium]